MKSATPSRGFPPTPTHWFDARLDAAKTVVDAEKSLADYPTELLLEQLSRPESWEYRERRKRADLKRFVACLIVFALGVSLCCLGPGRGKGGMALVVCLMLACVCGVVEFWRTSPHEIAQGLVDRLAGRARSVTSIPALLLLRETLETKGRAAEPALSSARDALARLLSRVTIADAGLFSTDDLARLRRLTTEVSSSHSKHLAT